MHRAVHFWPSFLTRVMRNAPVTGPRRWAPHLLVCTENLDSHVLVMQSTENSMRPDATDPLNRAREWRVFVQRSVRFSNRCNSGHKLAEFPRRCTPAQGDHMVEALASDGSNQSFGEAVLPRRTVIWRAIQSAVG